MSHFFVNFIKVAIGYLFMYKLLLCKNIIFVGTVSKKRLTTNRKIRYIFNELQSKHFAILRILSKKDFAILRILNEKHFAILRIFLKKYHLFIKVVF